MEFLEGFLVTDIYLVNGYKFPTILLPQLFHKLHGMDRDDSAKAPLKIPSILHIQCPIRITPIRFFSN
ncbi:hypothetical protein [uncultured Prochlorococcus sp.]|uniref:hypothetical protein n=1 Tax=uncultured Prochlorococcus sp. TaxID=159733 RepID=UPI002587A3B6|nr:hypothetical protein [uncultured Prochlorococcus sp.]